MESINKKSDQPCFSLPVDSDGKATTLRIFSIAPPHMRAFNLAWISLFACFFSTFSIPPMLPVIRRDLRLSAADVGTAGIASFVGSIFSRLAMGPICDIVGPRRASAAVSLLTAPVVLSVSLVSSPGQFIVVRFLIGFCLANFVSCQFWMSSMFSGEVVGAATAVSAGWACAGSGLTQLVMPLIYSFLTDAINLPSSTAWRVAFIFPAIFQIITAIAALALGQDLPYGKYRRIPKPGTQSEENALSILFNGLKNYRAWILGLTYAFCFGVELTSDNIIAQYFYDRFGLDMETAGAVAASFALANVVSRPSGGWLSDAMGRRFGMRGRLWSLWSVQTVAGLLCFVLGRVNSLWGSIAVMCCFSLFVQAASGLTFGVVPFVSKRIEYGHKQVLYYTLVAMIACGCSSLGVVSGMTGSGGAMGAVATQLLLFSGRNPELSTQTSISLMGLIMILCGLPISLIYFPQSGGMFCGPSSTQTHSHNYHLLE